MQDEDETRSTSPNDNGRTLSASGVQRQPKPTSRESELKQTGGWGPQPDDGQKEVSERSDDSRDEDFYADDDHIPRSKEMDHGEKLPQFGAQFATNCLPPQMGNDLGGSYN